FLALFFLALAGLVGWYGYSPIAVMGDFQAAVDSGKAEALVPFMDVPDLKKNVVTFVKLRFNRPDNPSADLPPEQVQSVVNAFVTPDNILLMMKGVHLEPGTAPPAPSEDKTPHPIEKHYESPDFYD